MTVRPFFRWFDLWVGVYLDLPNSTAYVCPLPCIGLAISRKRAAPVDPCREGHADLEEVDRVASVKRDRAGEIVEASLVRVSHCHRCRFHEETPIPPESVPADVFDRIEQAIDSELETVAIKRIRLELGPGRSKP